MKIDTIIKEVHPNPFTYIGADIGLIIHPNFHIQIDTLIITPYYALVLEIKNMPGILRFNEHPAYLERERETGEIDIFDCPLVQLERNKKGLNIWLSNRGFHLPVIGMVVLASSRSAVKSLAKEKPVIKSKQLPIFLEKFNTSEMYQTKHNLTGLVTQIRRENSPYLPLPACEKYSIDVNQIKKGILCQDCNGKLNRKTQRMWYCNNCNSEVLDPYLLALQDWFLLIKPTISNEECRDFLGLKDKYAANYLLNSFNLEKEGQSRATLYRWNPRIELNRKNNTKGSNKKRRVPTK